MAAGFTSGLTMILVKSTTFTTKNYKTGLMCPISESDQIMEEHYSQAVAPSWQAQLAATVSYGMTALVVQYQHSPPHGWNSGLPSNIQGRNQVDQRLNPNYVRKTPENRSTYRDQEYLRRQQTGCESTSFSPSSTANSKSACLDYWN